MPRNLKAFGLVAYVLPLLLALAASAWLHTRGLYALSDDETSRVAQAWGWAFQGRDGFAGSWLPGFVWIYGAALKLFPEVLLTPKVVTALFGAAAVPLTAWLAWELFQDRAVCALSAWIALLLPERVLVSSVPFAEAAHLAFLVLGMAALARFINTAQGAWFALAAGSVALACTLRFEAWLFGAGLGLWALVALCRLVPFADRRWAWAALGLLVLFPATYLVVHRLGSSSWMTDSTAYDYERLYGASRWERWSNGALCQFFRQNLASLNLIGVVPLALLGWRERRIRSWLLVPVLSLSILGSATLLTASVLPTHRFWRLPIPWTVLLSPFTAYLLVVGTRRFIPPVLVRGALQLGFLAALCVLSLRTIEPQLPGSVDGATAAMSRDVAHFFDDGTLRNGARVLVVDSGHRGGNLRATAGDPSRYLLAKEKSSDYVGRGGLSWQRVRSEDIGAIVADKPLAKKLRSDANLKLLSQQGRWLLFQALDAPVSGS